LPHGQQPPVVDEEAAIAVADTDEEPEPQLVKTKRFEMKPMAPEDATMQMELLDHDVRGFWEQNGYHDRGDPWTEQRYHGD